MARRKIADQEEVPAEDLPTLTAQQLDFVKELLSGKNASDAYRAAYDCSNMLPNTIWCEASKLRNCPKVSQWVSAAKKAHLGASTLSLENHLRELERLKEAALESGNHGAAIQAEQLRGKASGHYVDQIRDLTFDPHDTLAQIAELSPELAKILANQEGIEFVPEGETKH